MKRKFLKLFLFIFIPVGLAASGIVIYLNNSVSIKSIQLSSPDNYAMNEEVSVELNKEQSIFIEYWKEGSSEKFKTQKTGKAFKHLIKLLLLEPDVTYNYQVIINGVVDISSKELSFHTRKQSPWLIHNWVKEENPHDEKSLGNGLVMLCNARLPGYIAMVDGKGSIRWYWQT